MRNERGRTSIGSRREHTFNEERKGVYINGKQKKAFIKFGL
jgi:hypothetical protein